MPYNSIDTTRNEFSTISHSKGIIIIVKIWYEYAKLTNGVHIKKNSVIFSTPHYKLALNWPVSIFCVAWNVDIGWDA